MRSSIMRLVHVKYLGSRGGRCVQLFDKTVSSSEIVNNNVTFGLGLMAYPSEPGDLHFSGAELEFLSV